VNSKTNSSPTCLLEYEYRAARLPKDGHQGVPRRIRRRGPQHAARRHRKALDKLASDLSKLRTGGRFKPELLEALRMHLDKDSKASRRVDDDIPRNVFEIC